MVAWALSQHAGRIVDMGCGSSRFTVTAARANPSVEVIAVDLGPVATTVCRANAALSGSRSCRPTTHISSLAGLHVHFYLATARCVRPGDVGCLVTGAEWLDVGYGSVVRTLLARRIGLRGLHLLDPKSHVLVAMAGAKCDVPIRLRD